MRTDLLHSLFHDILDHGSVHIRKSKLLWMLGRVHETPSVWDRVIAEWQAFGQTRPLFGFHWGDAVTLTLAPAENVAESWTSRVETPEPARQHQLVLVG